MSSGKQDPDGTTIQVDCGEESSDSDDLFGGISAAPGPFVSTQRSTRRSAAATQHSQPKAGAAATLSPSPTGITVRRRTPGSRSTTSAMSSPSPTTRAQKGGGGAPSGRGKAKAVPKKVPTTERRTKQKLRTAPPLPAADVAKAMAASFPPTDQGQEEEKVDAPTPTTTGAGTDPKPFSQCLEAAVDGDFKSNADITFNSDSEDEDEWEGNIGE